MSVTLDITHFRGYSLPVFFLSLMDFFFNCRNGYLTDKHYGRDDLHCRFILLHPHSHCFKSSNLPANYKSVVSLIFQLILMGWLSTTSSFHDVFFIIDGHDNCQNMRLIRIIWISNHQRTYSTWLKNYSFHICVDDGWTPIDWRIRTRELFAFQPLQQVQPTLHVWTAEHSRGKDTTGQRLIASITPSIFISIVE